jgi:hypothetical protein
MPTQKEIKELEELHEYYQKRLEIQKLRLEKQQYLRKSAERLFNKDLESEYQITMGAIQNTIENHREEIKRIEFEMAQLKTSFR